MIITEWIIVTVLYNHECYIYIYSIEETGKK